MRRAIILAGGRGTRLQPFTFAFPKPLVPVGEGPILDIILRQLIAEGITHITVAVGHLAELVMAYIGQRNYQGVCIDFSHEVEPLGTAGPLSLIDGLKEPFIVMNGDILTSLSFQHMSAMHSRKDAFATIAACRKTVKIDLGVLDVDEHGQLQTYREKPEHSYAASMGIYIFQPDVLGLLRKGEKCDLPELVLRILSRKHRLFVYEFDGFWLDIGRPEDYARAVEEFDRLTPELFRTARG